jgi:hypothetical protein
MSKTDPTAADANRDPLTGAPGAHPVGVGVGASGGAAAGAAVGSLAGPVGTAVGAAVGAIAGGLAGKGVAEGINPTVEDEYWQKEYFARSYVETGVHYQAYRPAYQFGWEAFSENKGRRFEEIEPELARRWEKKRGPSDLPWEKAHHAVRDAWARVDADHRTK